MQSDHTTGTGEFILPLACDVTVRRHLPNFSLVQGRVLGMPLLFFEMTKCPGSVTLPPRACKQSRALIPARSLQLQSRGPRIFTTAAPDKASLQLVECRAETTTTEPQLEHSCMQLRPDQRLQHAYRANPDHISRLKDIHLSLGPWENTPAKR